MISSNNFPSLPFVRSQIQNLKRNYLWTNHFSTMSSSNIYAFRQKYPELLAFILIKKMMNWVLSFNWNKLKFLHMRFDRNFRCPMIEKIFPPRWLMHQLKIIQHRFPQKPETIFLRGKFDRNVMFSAKHLSRASCQRDAV